jgi:hypothetical protein
MDMFYLYYYYYYSLLLYCCRTPSTHHPLLRWVVAARSLHSVEYDTNFFIFLFFLCVAFSKRVGQVDPVFSLHLWSEAMIASEVLYLFCLRYRCTRRNVHTSLPKHVRYISNGFTPGCWLKSVKLEIGSAWWCECVVGCSKYKWSRQTLCLRTVLRVPSTCVWWTVCGSFFSSIIKVNLNLKLFKAAEIFYLPTHNYHR